MTYQHTPVLADLILQEVLRPQDTLVIDATLGEGGHSALFLDAGKEVISLERDPRILAEARKRFANANAFQSHQINFKQAEALFAAHQGRYQLVLFDLGISMFHYKVSGRGFSFSQDEPLDMRLEPELPLSAAQIINRWPADELARLFHHYGGENRARKLAFVIADRRSQQAINTAKELADLIDQHTPAKLKQRGHHPATKVFQALRIEVNQELAGLEQSFISAATHLAPGGRIAVISYHSLEDKIVKDTFKTLTGPRRHRNKYRAQPDETEPDYQLLWSKPIVPSDEEIDRNRAARSAKLRVLEKKAKQ